MLKIFFLILMIQFDFIGCNFTRVEKPISLWDSRSYFDKQIHILNQQKIGIQKELLFNNELDTITKTQVNWENELAIFTLIDLSNPKNNGNYQLDTLINTDTICTISFIAIDGKPYLKLFTISTNPKYQKINFVEAIYLEKINLIEVRKKITYLPSQGFRIEESQQVKFGNKSTYTINAKFINN
jgi:hypothetical protein